MLSKVFFQKAILFYNENNAASHSNSKGRFEIGYQDEDTLKIIMRSVYLQAANNPNSITNKLKH